LRSKSSSKEKTRILSRTAGKTKAVTRSRRNGSLKERICSLGRCSD